MCNIFTFHVKIFRILKLIQNEVDKIANSYFTGTLKEITEPGKLNYLSEGFFHKFGLKTIRRFARDSFK